MRTTWTLIGLIAVATAAAAVAHYSGASSLLTFAIATVALAGLAWIVSFSTEQVGERFGPAVTGLLQSTLGNLPEFFIVVFALSAGEVVVAQTSIIGSIFANALLVLGLAVIAGCRESADGVMRFHARLPKDNAILMLLASFLIVILGI
jgi:Ca2+:H+ antiporter